MRAQQPAVSSVIVCLCLRRIKCSFGLTVFPVVNCSCFCMFLFACRSVRSPEAHQLTHALITHGSHATRWSTGERRRKLESYGATRTSMALLAGDAGWAWRAQTSRTVYDAAVRLSWARRRE